MFENLIAKVKGMFHGMAQVTGIEQAKKDVFDLVGVPSYRQFYNIGIFPWKWIYRGYYKLWHLVPAPTIANQKATRDMERLDTAKAVCQELASLMWSEKCGVSVSQKGYEATDDKPDLLNLFVNAVLNGDEYIEGNNFTVKMQEHLEQTLALGGGALMVWAEPTYKLDDKGNPIQDDNGQLVTDPDVQPKIVIGYYMADQFVPLAWSNSDITEGLFISRQAKGGYYYTTLAWHQWDGTTYIIRNQLYRAEQKPGIENQNILGFQRPLDEVYKFLSPETPIVGLKRSLFSYYRPNTANNLDDNSPLGISLYANALSTLKALDIAFDSFIREFILGRKRIIVPASAIRQVIDPDSGQTLRYFDANDEVYQALSTDDPESLKILDNSVEIRVDEHVLAINALLGILSFQLSLSPGTLTFDDKAKGIQTATQVISEKDKTYKTMTSHEIPLKAAIEKLVDNIIDIAVLYDIEYQGIKIADLIKKGYTKNIYFDDSIIKDKQSQVNEGIMLMGARVKSRKTFMIETLGMTPQGAEDEITQISKEDQITGATVDDVLNPEGDGGGGGEA